jgi:hypothetical protein
MKSRLLSAALMTLVVVELSAGRSADAHHSFAMFNMDKEVTLVGTVRTFEWSNPHAWLWIYVTDIDGSPVADKDGKPVLYGLEGAAPGELLRQGITRLSLKPGDRITVKSHTLKDGRNGGNFNRITLADGKTLGIAPPAVQPGASSSGAKY